MEKVVELRNVTKEYPSGNETVTALNDASLDVYKGQLVLILGPSGSGKTTMLLLLGGIEQPTRGDIFLNGMNLNSLKDNEKTRLRLKHVGLKLELPIFEGMQKDRQSASLKILEENLHRQKEQLQSEIGQKAGILQNKMVIAQKETRIKRNELTLSRQLFKSTIQNFRNGLVSMKDVTNAELDLNIKEMQYLRAVYSYLQSQLDYEQLTGGGEDYETK